MPLLDVPFFPSLSTTWAPNETVFLPLLAVPGVFRMVSGFLEGETGVTFSFGAGKAICFAFAASILVFFSSFLLGFASSIAGVPKMTCLKAL
jgi:hypothetical protein